MKTFPISITGASFYIFWTLLLVGKGLGMTSANPYMVKMTWVAVFFAVFKLCFTKWKKTEFIAMVILLSLGLVVFLKTLDAAALLTMMTICASKSVDLRQLFKYSFWLKAIMFVIITTLVIFNVIDSQPFIRYEGDVYTVRYGLGYGHPNAAHYTFFIICVLFFLTYRNMKTIYFVLLECYNIFLFSFTVSRTGFLLTSLLILCNWAIKSKVVYRLFCKFGNLLSFIYVILAVLSFATPLFVNVIVSEYAGLGTALSRLKTGTAVVINNVISLFGNGGITTDYGFIFIGYQYGLIILIIYILGNTLLLRKFLKKHYLAEFFILVIYALYTMLESYSASILMNTSLLLLSLLLYSENSAEYLKKDFEKK